MTYYRIVMLSAGDMTAASSRLRCFFIGQKLKQMGREVWLNEAPGETHVVFVQKRITPQILNYVMIAKQRGAILIYDLDDYGPALAWLKIDPAVEKTFLSLCDIITTDTPTRLQHVAADPKYQHIRTKLILADPIDYMLEPREKPAQASSGPQRGAWFGNDVNLVPAIPFLQGLATWPGLGTFNIFTNASSIQEIKAQFPKFGCHAWELGTFAQNFYQHDFSLLIHAQDIEGEQKSNNKMLVSLALGILPFVSDTAAYRDTAIAIGVPELVVKTPLELIQKLSSPDALAMMRQKLRAPQCLDYLDRFSVTQVALGLDTEIRKLIFPAST